MPARDCEHFNRIVWNGEDVRKDLTLRAYDEAVMLVLRNIDTEQTI